MRRTALLLVLLAVIGQRTGLIRYLVPRVVTGMAEHVMPRMISHCFALLDRDQRRFILAHCRGALDEMEAKYVRSEPPQ